MATDITGKFISELPPTEVDGTEVLAGEKEGKDVKVTAQQIKEFAQQGMAKASDVKTKTSELTNDSNFVADPNYQHTDNNFTDEEKQKLGSLVPGEGGGAVSVPIDTLLDDTSTNDKAAGAKAVVQKLAALEKIENSLSIFEQGSGLTLTCNVTVQNNSYINTSGKVSSLNSWEVKTIDLTTSEITKYEADVWGPNRNDHYIFAYYDINHSFLGGLKNNNSGKNTVSISDISIPEGAAFFSISCYKGEKLKSILEGKPKQITPNLLQRTEENKRLSIQNQAHIGDMAFEKTINDKCFISASGTLVSNPDWKIITVDVGANDITVYSANVQYPGGNDHCIVAYYDINNKFLGGLTNVSPDKTDVELSDLKIPQGCRYVRFSKYNLKKITLDGVAKSLSSRLKKLESEDEYNDEVTNKEYHRLMFAPYKEKKLGQCGDSITQGYEAHYQGYAQRIADSGIFKEVHNVAAGGSGIDQVLSTQLPKLLQDCPDVDIITIATCTNNFSSGVPVGNWYSSKDGEKRVLDMSSNTMKAKVNKVMDYIHKNFPKAQVIWLTPIRKANWTPEGEVDGQGDDLVPKNGVYLSDYRQMFLETQEIWNCGCCDMWALSGLDPHVEGQRQTFFNGVRQWSGTAVIDGVHVGPSGGERMYKAFLGFLIGFLSM